MNNNYKDGRGKDNEGERKEKDRGGGRKKENI